MSGKRRIKHLPSIQKPQLDYSKLDINQIDSVIKGLEVQKNIVLEKSLNGGDLEQIMKAQSYLSKNEKTKPQIKSHIFVPEDYQYTGRGYKDSYSGVPFEVLQRMSNIPIVRTIIGTRIDQIKNFLKYSNDDQVAGYKVKRKTGLFTEDNKKELSAEDKRKIEFIVNCLEYGGKGGKWDDGDDLHDFVTKIMSDSLSIDQATAEIIRDRKGDYYKHAAVDGSLIRLLDSTDVRYQKQFEDMQVNGYLPKYGQVWNGQIVNNPVTGEPVIYYPWQLMYGVRNKTTDVRANGYGKSELEVGLELITYIVWGIQYNGNFFKQGSNPKGFVNIKNGNLNNSVLNEFRQAWTQLVVGVNNSHRLPIFEGIDLEWVDMHHCLHGDTNIIVPAGNTTIDNLLKEESVVETEVWDGICFNKAKVFKTGEKKLCKTILSNRLKIKTSPNHKFLTLRDNEAVWVEQKDLITGDYVFVNKNTVNSNKDSLIFNGKKVEEDLFELIGWILGDGHIGKNLNSKRMIRTFYHPEKELDIIEKHRLICDKYGINNRLLYYYKKLEQVSKYNIKSLIGKYPILTICDANFFMWLIDLGFKTSSEGKNIPDFIYTIDSNLKNALLRGLFSADGHISKDGYVINLTVTSKTLKDQVRRLLLTEGIRTTSFKSPKTSNSFGEREDVVILIKDRELYFEKIGFNQEYKKERQLNRKKSKYNDNEAPVDFVRNLALEIKKFNKTLSSDCKLNKKDLHDLLNISRGHQKASLSKVTYYANKIGYKLPYFIENFNMEIVTELVETEEFVEMYDVEMFNSNHQFIANGIVVHNSNKDMEFQQWNEFLIVLLCALYKIDPSELGFHFKNQADMFGQQGQKERIDHSRKKGLEPLLVFLQKLITKYIVSEIDENYEFVFTGLSIEDESAQVELDTKKLTGGMVSFESMFEKYMGRKYDEKKDTILNAQFLQAKQMSQYGGQEMNDMVDEQTGEPEAGIKNPFDEFEKSKSSDPIVAAALRYMDENLIK